MSDLGHSSALRVVTWNLSYRVGEAAERQGRFLDSLDPDIVLLQEVNAGSLERLAAAAGLEWVRCSLDLREPMPGEKAGRRRGCAIGGRGTPPAAVRLLTDVPLPERLLIGRLHWAGLPLTVVSYHAPPGVSWFEKKPQQAVALAHWLAAHDGPVIFGGDTNTPETDHPDFKLTRTHWHTGDAHLKGAPGDDLLVGPDKIHGLDDALRRWLDDHPDQLEAIRAERPTGPLAVSHYTGKGRERPGTPRRYDSLWVSGHFHIRAVEYLYEQSCAAGSDHAAVYTDLVLSQTRPGR